MARGTFAGADRLHEPLPPRHESTGGHAREGILALHAQDCGERAGYRQPSWRLRGGKQCNTKQSIFSTFMHVSNYYTLNGK